MQGADEGIQEERDGAGRAAAVSEATGRQQTTGKSQKGNNLVDVAVEKPFK